jgi:hypothetical protein
MVHYLLVQPHAVEEVVATGTAALAASGNVRVAGDLCG